MQDASSKQQTKQKYKPNHQLTGLPPRSALPIRGKTNNKNSAQISWNTKLIQTTGPTLGRQKPKGRNNSDFLKERIQLSLREGDLKHNNLKEEEKIKLRRNTAQMKEQNRNTEVQINEEEIGK